MVNYTAFGLTIVLIVIVEETIYSRTDRVIAFNTEH